MSERMCGFKSHLRHQMERLSGNKATKRAPGVSLGARFCYGDTCGGREALRLAARQLLEAAELAQHAHDLG